MKKRRVIRVSKFEKFLYMGAMTAFMLTFTLQIFAGAALGNAAISVEKLKYKVTSQEKQNESLIMKVNELTAFDNVKNIVKDMGLAYNNDNIIVIDR